MSSTTISFMPLLCEAPHINCSIKNITIIINDKNIKFSFHYIDENLYAIKLIDQVNNNFLDEIKDYIKNKYSIELIYNDDIPFFVTNNNEKVITINDEQYCFEFLMFNDIILQISLSLAHYDIINDVNKINLLKSYILNEYNMELYMAAD